MSPDRWRAVADLFDRTVELAPVERRALLDREAVSAEGAPDAALREEVERLLALDAGGDTLLDAPGPVGEGPPPYPRLGPWRLTERLGRGGMGEVWAAERAEGDFRQRAAVKLVRPGLGEDLVARFRSERQILATLDHPSIARLLGGGEAPDGRPWLSMERVDGERITTYCDRRRLTINARLALFIDVCDAVAYAHARLVVHRDLKPSNILVAEGTPASGAGAAVKLLDFGVAKLLAADGMHTRTGRALHTPAYAAPEQAAGKPVTTAADVYSLGVVLYELLSGRRPPRTDTGETVTRPSDALSGTAATGGRVPVTLSSGEPRGTTPERLRRRLRGDLDRIVLRALRSDPERRYRGAAELGADLRRHLDGLPVEAQPERWSYLAGKFIRRHRAAVAAGTLAVLALAVGLGVALWQTHVARVARGAAEASAADAEAASTFLSEILLEGDPGAGDARNVAAMQPILRGAASRLRTDTTLPPRVRARLLERVGEMFQRTGMTRDAEPLLREALATYRTAFGPDHPGTANVHFRLGDLIHSRAPDSAATHYLTVVRLAARPEHDARAPFLASWALVYLAHDEPPGSDARRALVRRALAAVPIPPDHVPDPSPMPAAQDPLYHRLRIEHVLVSMDIVEDSLGRVLARHSRTVSERRGWAAHAALSRSAEAVLHWRSGDRDAALATFDQAYRGTRTALGRAHGRTAWLGLHYAERLVDAGRPAEAVTVAEEAVAGLDALFGDARSTRRTGGLMTLGRARLAAGDAPGARASLQRARDAWAELLGPDSSPYARADSLLRAAGG